MLKFKLTHNKLGLDVKTLKVTSFERLDDPVYELTDGDVVETNKVEYTFHVKDLYNIQADSHINVAYSAIVGNSEGGTRETYNNVKECIVTSADKNENTLKICLDKEIELNVTDVSIETRYNIIYYSDNHWQMQQTDRSWIDNICEDYNEIICVDTDKAPYGANAYNDSTVFYYENDSWKNISLEGDKLEDCLKVNKIYLKSIHEYDETERTAVRMEQENLYYTHENYIVLNISPSHYFGEPTEEYDNKEIEDKYLPSFNDYNRLIVKNVEYPKIYMYMEYYNGTTLTPDKLKIEKEVHIDGNGRLIFNYDLFKDNAIIETTVKKNLSIEDMLNFEDDTEISIDGMTENQFTMFEDKLFPNGYYLDTINKFGKTYELNETLNEVQTQKGVVGNIEFKRDNFIIEGDNVTYSLIYDSTVNVVQIPISQKFETDLFHNDALQTNYVDRAKENAINPIVDMEKDVYSPAISVKPLSNDGQINSDYVDAYKIIFNLHFRKHRDTMSSNGTTQEWLCDKDAYWNGTTYNDDKLELKPSISEGNDNGYFSYYAIKDSNENKNEKGRNKYADYQSDLLSFLGFSNDDIKYQKSKLKKTFLRISFYDSENVGNQNLLHTSTIFLDSGDLFAKYIKNIDTVDANGYGTYMATVGSSFVNSDTNVSYNVNGLRVNREPMREPINGDDALGDDVDEWEELRLSSQFVVTDKYSSKHSSEGFYFYTYKSNDNGVYPSDIYMRVEFNHAGYGRTIPFMMPYVRENERKDEKGPYYGQTKIKSFENICNDWSAVDKDGKQKDENDIGYGSVKYVKYSHIKWKYRYDKKTQKHIYYLDPEQYGSSVTSTNGHGHNIILNLYEGKIR